MVACQECRFAHLLSDVNASLLFDLPSEVQKIRVRVRLLVLLSARSDATSTFATVTKDETPFPNNLIDGTLLYEKTTCTIPKEHHASIQTHTCGFKASYM